MAVSIALDATYAAFPELTGTGLYSRRLIEALAASSSLTGNSPYRLVLCFRPGPYWRWARRQNWPTGCQITPFWEPWLAPRRARLFHGLNQRLPHRRYPATVVTIHDLFPLTSTEYSAPQFQRHFSAILLKTVAAAGRIIAVSEATRQQLIRHTSARPDRIRVIHHGVDAPDFAEEAEKTDFTERVLQLRPDEKFFLNVGTIQTRKNVANIVLALQRLPRFRLVLAGGDGFGAEAVHSLIAREGMGNQVLRLGYTPSHTLRLLYTTATALVFPSFEEGFGLPILEAMSYGLPVITSNCSAMPEVAGDAALFVDPLNVSEIGLAMQRVAEDTALAADLCQRGRRRAGLFRWDRCAEQAWQVYEELLQNVGVEASEDKEA
ncbi:MAG: glycosyltransferase family 4 protein [Acidobacteria bacterium]|nr:glycosyltransferase family 4 protein [Acidobacteriota bacterium]